MKKRVSAGRGVRVRVKSAKSRTASSTRWLARQLNDPYVAEAKAKGYRSRAAFKLLELDDKFHFLKRGVRVLDLGAAPGGWSQVAAARVGREGRVVAIDILEMEAIAGVHIFKADLMDAHVPEQLKTALDGPADVVCPTWRRRRRAIAPPITFARWHCSKRHSMPRRICLSLVARLSARCSRAAPRKTLLERAKQRFRDVKHVKPPASRTESVELYLVALGYKG